MLVLFVFGVVCLFVSLGAGGFGLSSVVLPGGGALLVLLGFSVGGAVARLAQFALGGVAAGLAQLPLVSAVLLLLVFVANVGPPRHFGQAITI